MRNKYKILPIVVLLASILTISSNPSLIKAAQKAKTVKIGKTLDLNVKDATSYQSNNTDIAYVNQEGRVTGKKIGTAVICIKKNNKITKQEVVVKSNGKKPGIKVCLDEINLKNVKVQIVPSEENNDNEENVETTPKPDDNTTDSPLDKPPAETPADENQKDNTTDKPDVNVAKTYTVQVTIKNNSKNTAKKVILEGTVGKTKVKFTFNSVKAGKTITDVKEVSTAENEPEFTALKLSVYSVSMVSVYDYNKKQLSYNYGTKDTVAPVISGFIETNSYNEGIPYQVVYKGEEYNYFKYVKAEDDRDSDVSLTVDTSMVDYEKKGTYTITYIAKDKEGNTSKAKAKIGIRVNDDFDKMAESVLKNIIKANWSDQKKATSIYNYTRGHIAYTGTSDKSSWEKAARNGLRSGRGDCYTYYAVSRLLLTKAGIPNIKVTRVKGIGRHWWNMAYVKDGFYHFDTCPRRVGGRFCLVTDDQLKSYSKNRGGNSHIWDYDNKPKTPHKKISSI